MDSTGSFVPDDVYERISTLKKLDMPIGFHGHNNLNLAVANSLIAIKSGASIIDVTLHGFGAGAGNTPLEVMMYLHQSKLLDKKKILEYCEICNFKFPICKPINILTAKYKMFSGYEKHILQAAHQYDISYISLIDELGKQNLNAGQENFIYITAKTLKSAQIF